jgi:hypothetical protein
VFYTESQSVTTLYVIILSVIEVFVVAPFKHFIKEIDISQNNLFFHFFVEGFKKASNSVSAHA